MTLKSHLATDCGFSAVEFTMQIDQDIKISLRRARMCNTFHSLHAEISTLSTLTERKT